jgi:Sec-independent protein translocase protein TatA
MDRFHSIGMPELVLILVVALVSVGWKTLRRR